MFIPRILPSLALVGVIASAILAQSAQVRRGGEISRPARLTVEPGVQSFVSGRDHGLLGTASLTFPVLGVPPLAHGTLFGRDLIAKTTAGIGYFIPATKPRTQSTMQYAEAGIDLPITDVASFVRMPLSVVMRAGMSAGIGTARNHRLGRNHLLSHLSVHLGMDIPLSSGFEVGLTHRWTRIHSSLFRGPRSFRTVGISLSLSLESLGLRQESYRSQSDHAWRETHNRLNAIGDSLLTVYGEIRDIRRETSSAVREALEPGLDEIRRNVGSIRRTIDSVARAETPSRTTPTVSASLAMGGSNGHESTPYDEAVQPPTRLIRVEKQVFEHEDLVEEMYLKSILAILNSYDNYVWEIAYRDEVTPQGVSGHLLATKLSQFFGLYNARFSSHLFIRHDDRIRPEFEIRCLGLAR